MMQSKLFACLLFLAVTAAAVRAQTTENKSNHAPARLEKHIIEKVVSHHARIQYLVSLPGNYATNSDRYPLILYLHGGSLRGDDIDQMKRWGPAEKAEADSEFPFIVVSPQCSPGEIWTDVDALAAVLDEVMQRCRVDPERVYVTGHSMGGRGALYAAYKMPGRFAAVLALSPISPISAWAEKLNAVPVWIFHGANDQFTPAKEVQELVQAIAKAGGHPEFTLLPDRDHYILDVYNRSDVYKWLTEQRRKRTE
jgi:predicted peptidase